MTRLDADEAVPAALLRLVDQGLRLERIDDGVAEAQPPVLEVTANAGQSAAFTYDSACTAAAVSASAAPTT